MSFLILFVFHTCYLYLARAAQFKLPLRTSGRFIMDAQGRRVKLACTNWYGAHMETFVQNGLNRQSAETISRGIAGLGFNCVRLSYSVEAYIKNPVVQPEYISELPNSTGRRFLDVFDEVVTALTAQGLMVIVNNHNSDAGWCCDPNDGNGLWFTVNYSESAWITSLQGFAQRYRSNPLVIGYDLRNEPRLDFQMGLSVVWGETAINPHFRHIFRPMITDWMDWRAAVERAGAVVLQADPHALIFIEVLFSWFMCPFHTQLFPLQSMQGHVVWSAHEYSWFNENMGWAWQVCEKGIRYYHYSAIPLFLYHLVPHLEYLLILIGVTSVGTLIGIFVKRQRIYLYGPITTYMFGSVAIGSSIVVLLVTCLRLVTITPRPINDYASFASSRDAVWGHIVNSGIGPMWVGEFGTNTPSVEWNWTITYLRERDLDFAYWSIDGQKFSDEEESYGLWETDYRTVRHDWKLSDVQSLVVPTQSTELRGSEPSGESLQEL